MDLNNPLALVCLMELAKSAMSMEMTVDQFMSQLISASPCLANDPAFPPLAVLAWNAAWIEVDQKARKEIFPDSVYPENP
jgi:hypothetical protein